MIDACGLRLREGTPLQVADIDPHRGLGHVRQGPGGNDRWVPRAARHRAQWRGPWPRARDPGGSPLATSRRLGSIPPSGTPLSVLQSRPAGPDRPAPPSPEGATMSDSVAVVLPLTGLSVAMAPRPPGSPEFVHLGGTLPGAWLPHRASAPATAPSTRLRRLLTPSMPADSPRRTAQIFSSSGPGWIKIPDGPEPRCSSTAFL